MIKNLFSDADKKMITPEGDIYRYIGSDKIDSFELNGNDLRQTYSKSGGRRVIIIEDFYKNRPTRIYEDYSPSLRSERQGLKVLQKKGGLEMGGQVRIRKLTPTECYKLMGFTAEDCQKVSEGGISNAQLYKQAGNSIVVNVLEEIFKSLGETYAEFQSNV